MAVKQLPTMRICIMTQSLRLPLNRRAMMVLSPLYFPTEAAGLASRPETDKALAMMAVDSPMVVTCRFFAATPWQLARQPAGLCESHWQYGDNAFNCADLANCKWQGN
jgi:hypothetical protein